MSKSSKLSYKLKRISESLEDFFDPLVYRGYSDKNKLFEVLDVDNPEIAIFLNRLRTIFKTLMTKLEFVASGATLPKILRHKKLPLILEKYHYRIVTDAFAPFPKFTEDDQTTSEDINSSEGTGECALLYKLITASSNTSSEPNKEEIFDDFDECRINKCKCELESVDSSCESTEHRASVHNAIDILMSYPQVVEILKNSERNISKASLDFLRQIKFFMEFLLAKAKLTPEKQRATQLRTRELSQQVEQIKQEINDLSNLLDDQKRKNGAELEDIADELNKAMDTWYLITSQFQEDLANLVKNSLENQAKSKEEFEERMENHRQALHSAKVKMQAEKASHSKEESDVQGKKFKVESQLASIIMKFDSEVSEREEAFQNLAREYRALNEDRIQLIKDMEEQLTIHTNIIREREEKTLAEFNKKFRKFMRNHAAKVIQRWWRAFYIIMKKNKRKKGKKKGK